MIRASTPESLDQSHLTFNQVTQDMCYDDDNAFDEFRDVYRAKSQRAPYTSPPSRAAWNSCKAIVKIDRDEAARKVS